VRKSEGERFREAGRVERVIEIDELFRKCKYISRIMNFIREI
jgi:hypothetical protein